MTVWGATPVLVHVTSVPTGTVSRSQVHDVGRGGGAGRAGMASEVDGTSPDCTRTVPVISGSTAQAYRDVPRVEKVRW
ncbi:MAG: hypothetical protein ACRDVM_03620 [Acidimicrobiia bacterium]